MNLTIRTKLLVVALFAMMLASCTADPDPYDWCFIYDFRTSDQDFNLVNGEWREGIGLVTDPSGLLVFNKFEGEITPSGVTVTVSRVDSENGVPINASANGNIFGISAAFQQQLPSFINNAQLVFKPANIGDGGANVNVSVSADYLLAVQSIRITGTGSGSYPLLLECQNNLISTPTPPPSPLPELATNTPAPTTTPTYEGTVSTPQGTISATPSSVPVWQCEYDFTTGAHGWTPFYITGYTSSYFGKYTAGVGFESVYVTVNGPTGNAYQLVAPTISFASTTLKSVEYRFTRTQGSHAPAVNDTNLSISAKQGGGYYYLYTAYRPAYGSSPTTWTGSESGVTSVSVEVRPGQSATKADPGGSAIITYAKLTGTGTAPCLQGTVTPSPTPTPTFTPSPSPTPTTTSTQPFGDQWSCGFDFKTSAAGWAGTGIRQDGTGWISSGSNTITINLNGATMNTIRVTGSSAATMSTSSGIYISSVRVFNPDKTAGALQWNWFGNVSNSVNAQITVNPADGTSGTIISFVSMRGSGVNPCPGNETPVPSRTPYPTATGQPPTRTPIVFKTSTPRPTSTTRPTGTPLPTDAPTGTPLPSNTPLPSATPYGPTVTLYPTYTPGGPTVTLYPTYTPGGPPGPTATPGGPGVTATPGGPPMTPGGTPGGPGSGPGSGYGWGEYGTELSDIAGFAGQIVSGLGNVLTDYLGDAIGLSTGLLGGFFSAPLIPVPGLPDCINAPTLSELCAVWYIMDWTFFAPGTPGALIVPLLRVIIIILLVVVVIRSVIKLIRTGEKATSA